MLQTIIEAMNLVGFDGLAAQRKMMPVPRPVRRPAEMGGQARKGAVLLLLYPKHEQLHFVLTRRPDTFSNHAGQISLPGGRQEANETFAMAALRETHEEIGVDPAGVQLLGPLTPLYIPPSDFEVHPFVGWHPTQPGFVPAGHEVAELIETPLQFLFNPATRQREMWELRGVTTEIPFFQIYDHKVWGATAIILGEFVERLTFVRANRG